MITSVLTALGHERREFPVSLYRYFNQRGTQFRSDENEPAIRKYLRSICAL